MRHRICVVPLLAVLAGCHLADPEARLIGVWEFTGPDGEQGECPDIIEFQAGGDYMVWNECFGDDPTNPVVESGSWRVPNSTTLQLTDRELLSVNESPWGEAEALQFFIFELSSDSLRFSAGASAENVERYRRLETN